MKVPDLLPDSIQDGALPFFLKTEVLPREADSLFMNFGRYEFLPTDSRHILFSIDSLTIKSGDVFSTANAGISMPYSLWVNSVFFLLFIFCFVLFSFVFHREGVALTDNLRHFLMVRKRAASVSKEQVTTTEVWGDFFLMLQTLLIVTILFFTFLWDKGLSSLTWRAYTVTCLGSLLALTIMTLLKFLMYRIIGTFFLQREMKEWTSRYYRILGLLGVSLFLPALFYVFLPESRNIMLIIILLIFITNRLAIVIGLLNIFVKNKVGGFYFFVYLCGTEIAPYLLCYRGVLSFISMAGINII
jgi:hypothetical protein